MFNEKWNNFKNCYINYDYSFPQMSFNQCILSVHEGKKSFRVLYVFVIKMFMKMEVNSALSIASS